LLAAQPATSPMIRNHKRLRPMTRPLSLKFVEDRQTVQGESLAEFARPCAAKP
jgi:hypothetical protein